MALHNYFDRFCHSYVYLPYFIRVLRIINPRMVIVSNDHNVSNRSLLCAARYLGMQTAYLQHASVSSLFPPLRFDVAFLDGVNSLNCYLQCEGRAAAELPSKTIPKVFLSGQKKKIDVGHGRPMRGELIGIAVNVLDRPADLIKLVDRMEGLGFKIKLRWHPGQNLIEWRASLAALSERASVQFSDPATENLNKFFLACKVLIAGNSSIHLEAAIFGLPSIYFEITNGANFDYYGFVKAGLVPAALQLNELTIERIQFVVTGAAGSTAAVRKYSETAGTEWGGREGELVATSLQLIKAGEPLSRLYRSRSGAPPFDEVYGLATESER